MVDASGRETIRAERAATQYTTRGNEYHDNGERPGSAIGFATKGAAQAHAKANGWPKSAVERYIFCPWGNIVYCVVVPVGVNETAFQLADGRRYIVRTEVTA